MFDSADSVFKSMNEFGKESKPFLFGIDFKVENGFFIHPENAAANSIFYSLNGKSNFYPKTSFESPVQLSKNPIPFEKYLEAFRHVHSNLVAGNSYLTNLTFPTALSLNLSLSEVFARSNARYKLLYKDSFVVFSPETFVQISNGVIRSFPMKGTIDAAIAGAESQILNDRKEMAEHNTIVDLIRNDLSMVAADVKVERFRYIEKIDTNYKSLLQVSSEISGVLPPDYKDNIGTIFRKLLPAGSISGAPKQKTLQIINEAENYDRGFYTGVFGIFDGHSLDSGVMIRFIRKENENYTFCSGGGITVQSNPETEYAELIDKVYVPIV